MEQAPVRILTRHIAPIAESAARMSGGLEPGREARPLKIVELAMFAMCFTTGIGVRRSIVHMLRDPSAARVLTRSHVPETTAKTSGGEGSSVIPLRPVALGNVCKIGGSEGFEKLSAGL